MSVPIGGKGPTIIVPSKDYVYQETILKSNPVLYWPLDRADKYAYDYRPTTSPYASTNGNGAVSRSDGPFGSGSGASTRFSDTYPTSNNYTIPYASAGALRGTNMSLSIWARNTASHDNPALVVNHNVANTNGWQLFCYTNVNSYYYFQIAGLDNVVSDRPAVAGEWDHIGVTMSLSGPSVTKMFFNGKQTGYQSASTRNDNSDGDFTVGGLWVGSLAHLALYNYAMTPAQITEHYITGYNLRFRKNALSQYGSQFFGL